MNSMQAFMNGAANRGKELMVFDWETAASAGLREDWWWTGGDILSDGTPVPRDKTYTFLASTWATPELRLGDGTIIECYRMKSETPGWDSETYWPAEAMAILAGEPLQTEAVSAPGTGVQE